MARLFSLKPLVLALGFCFGTHCAAADAVAAEETDNPTAGGSVRSVSEPIQPTSLSLGSTCLFCSNESGKPEKTESAVQGSGEASIPEDYTRIVADRMEGQSQVQVRAEGNVVVERNRTTLNADWADYDQSGDTVTAGDRFALQQDGTLIRGETLTYNLEQQTGEAHNVRMETEHGGRRLQSVSRTAEMLGEGHYKLTETQFNTCSAGDAGWYVKAASVEADREKGIGVAKHAAFVFGGVPIFYTPWADFPLDGNRKSGLLVPSLSAGSDGVSLSVPYYFNLAPNLDATFAPGVIGERGAVFDGQVRYLRPDYAGQSDLTWLPHDKKSGRNNRYQAKWQHRHDISDTLQAGVDFNQVSDSGYYRDFYGNKEIAGNVNLNRRVWLDYGGRAAGGSLNAGLSVLKYQTLANQSGYKDKPYALMPRLSADWRKNTGRAQIGVSAQFTRFSHDSRQDGSRLVVYPDIKWDFSNSWGYVRPKLGLHATYYSLNRFGSQEARRVSRTLPIVNIDSGATFERNTRMFGGGVLQTLELRLFYNYIPAKSQNDLPNFDSSESSFGYGQLFRENLYYGNDRINTANSLSAAVQSRILDGATGEERFRAGIGQKFYFKNDAVMLDGSVGKKPRSRSDWVAFASSGIGSRFILDSSIHYNQNDKRAENYAVGASYRPAQGKVLNARYKYGRNEKIYLKSDGSYFYDKLSQLDLSAQWPLTRNLSAVVRYNYGFEAKKPIEVLAGAEYKSSCGCWGAGVYAQRYVTGENTYKNAVFFSLQLKDLSSVGRNPADRMDVAVPGYIPAHSLSAGRNKRP
ncbi:TPA: LPS-assembly protein LptD [Neisseria meningitidis]